MSAIRHGTKIGRFLVVAELGSGGMGVVYAAHDRELDRQVALKVMRIAVGDADNTMVEEDRIRMLREGQAMARVVHPNVITVFEVGSEGGLVFLAQELLDGGTLGQWLEKKHAPEAIIEKFIAAGRGLAAAHAVGLVHRDFKPDNVLLGKDGRIRVADFGLARAVGAFADGVLAVTDRGGGPPRTDIDVTKSPMSNLTRTGAVMGTPMYMAPEQHEGRRADERSDQFAFCVALYHALYGDWPFEGKTSIALADNVINGVMKEPPKLAKVPPRLRKILLRGLAKDAAQRYPSMEALLAELSVPATKSKAPLVLAIAGVLLVGGGGAAAYTLLRSKPVQAPPPVTDAVKTVAVRDDFDPTMLASAIDQGTLKATEKAFNNDGAAVAQASAAFVMVLRGDLNAAEAKLKDVRASDPKTAAYIDMAASAIAHARGELPTALERSERCANALGNVELIAAAMCLQTQGDAAADMDNASAAKRAYEGGAVIAQKLGRADLISMFELATAQVDFATLREDYPLETLIKQQKEARQRGAVSCEANAAVLASRVRLAKGDQQGALDVFDGIRPQSLQLYRTQVLARIARGEVLGYLDQGDEDGISGITHLEDVIDETKKREFWGLVLEAQLARARVMLTNNKEGAEEARQALIKDANARGFKRIARLAETYNPAAETPPPQ